MVLDILSSHDSVILPKKILSKLKTFFLFFSRPIFTFFLIGSSDESSRVNRRKNSSFTSLSRPSNWYGLQIMSPPGCIPSVLFEWSHCAPDTVFNSTPRGDQLNQGSIWEKITCTELTNKTISEAWICIRVDYLKLLEREDRHKMIQMILFLRHFLEVHEKVP